VRWLLHLGAARDACDSNGTSCLHIACRSGSLPVVCEVMRYAPLLEAVDVAGWTPLHIAAHMGRAEAAVRLLQAGASAHSRNGQGQLPSHLCLDRATREVLSGVSSLRGGGALLVNSRHYSEGFGVKLGSSSLDEENEADMFREELEGLRGPQGIQDSVGVPSQCERELFFVTPKPAIRDTKHFRKPLMHLLVEIFNLRPSSGLAFAVACGLADGYTAAARALLHCEGASRQKIGDFLGEDFSLCLLMRFGIFDSVSLLHTGVVAGLRAAFAKMQMPEDPRKMERLVNSVALVWWRKHRALLHSSLPRSYSDTSQVESPVGELAGLGLLQYLSSSEVLSQLMFSTVMLHWAIHGDGSGKRGDMSFQTWTKLNRGLEDVGKDVPEHVQRLIYQTVYQCYLPELRLAERTGLLSGQGLKAAKLAPVAAAEDAEKQQQQQQVSLDALLTLQTSALSSCAQVEGWVQLIGCGPPLVGSPSSGRGLVEECQSHSAVAPPDSAESFGAADVLPIQTCVWASLCSIMLLFSSSPPGSPPVGCREPRSSELQVTSPHAMLDVRQLQILQVHAEKRTLLLGGASSEKSGEGWRGSTREAPKLVNTVLLLQDGRWQEWSIPPLEIKVQTDEEFNTWMSLLKSKIGSPAASGNKTML